jgi:hypothetical protein
LEVFVRGRFSFGNVQLPTERSARMNRERQYIELGPNPVICQKWEESERGWGTRPDGFSLHLSYGGLAAYIRRHWDSLPDEAPDEYERPDGTPYPVGVSDAVVEELKAAGGDQRYYNGYAYPGSGGVDGWQTYQP